MNDEQILELIKNYQPNDEVKKQISKLRLVATVAPSASGKTTLMREAEKLSDRVHMVLGETTRQPRSTEKPGVDYVFRSREEVLQDLKNSELVDVVIGPNGDLYCTRIQNYNFKKINTMALVASTIQTFRELGFEYFKATFIVPSSYSVWRQWLDHQSEIGKWTDDDVRGRLAEARESYQIALSDPEIIFVLNDDISKSAQRLIQIMDGRNPEDERHAKDVAQANFEHLSSDIA